MKHQMIKPIKYNMPKKLYDDLIELLYEKGIQQLTPYITMVLREHLEKESKKS